MNVLGLVFSILLILSCGFYAIQDKQTAVARLHNTYISSQQAHRKLLNQFESKFYQNARKMIPNAPNEKDEDLVEEEEEEPKTPNKKKAPKAEKAPACNRECARLNLWPLIQEGREKHPLLYNLMLNLIQTFYGQFNKEEKGFETHFLNALLASAKAAAQEQEVFALEKVALSNPGLQKIYYKMLKGTKHWDLKEKMGYPPLMEYVQATPSQEKLCIVHAHPDLIMAVFNEKMGERLYEELHKKDAPPFTREMVQRVANETHKFHVDPDLLNMLDFEHYPNHKDLKPILVAEEGNVCLRKKLTL